MSTLDELKSLTDRLDEASMRYYRGENTEYTDTSFDLELHRLQEMEKELNTVFPNSPTQRVGSDALQGFDTISHPSPMLTIDNVYTTDDLQAWIDKIRSQYNVKGKINCSVKYDGVSCEIRYVNGYFKSASTRGDKNVGDDITENVKTIKSVPLYLRGLENVSNFYVRGEILMRKSVLTDINEERQFTGETLFANTRNACSGSIKLLDPKIVASRKLIFRAWDCFGDHCVFTDMDAVYDCLKRLGFYYEEGTFPISIPICDDTVNMVEEFRNNIKALNLDYDFDGVVLKINDRVFQESIGTKDTRAIEWGIARKWNEEYESKTTLLGVDWQVGRTGVLTPVGRLEPVECAGVTVTNVTLNNVDFIKMYDIHIGNTLKIVRSGGVIPYVTGVEHDLLMEMNKAYPEVVIPDTCPVCGHKLVMEGKILKCVNPHCPAIEKGKILQFCSKECCNIKSVGEAFVEDLYEKAGIKTLENFIDLVRGWEEAMALRKYGGEDIAPVVFINQLVKSMGEGYGEKSIRKFLDEAVRARKKTTYDKLLSSLSIPGIGKVMGRILAKEFPTIEMLCNNSIDELSNIDGIGDVIATDIYDWLHDTVNMDLVEKLFQYGWQCEGETKGPDEIEFKPLEDMVVCFTGKSNRFSGDDVEKHLEHYGAKCTHSVSKTMNYLITGDKPGGSKVKKAEELGVEIITEDEFYKKYDI